MAVPVQVRSNIHDEAYAGVKYHIEGELVPVLQIELGQVPVYFEHYVLLWKDPATQIALKALKGALKRLIAGMPVLLTYGQGPGRIAFSRDGAGQILPIHLGRGQAVDVREHQFLAATEQVEYGFTRVRGVSNLLFGGTGFFVDRFHCTGEEGIVWVHGYGNVFEITLAAGEQIDIEPGGWLYKDASVHMETVLQNLTSSLFGSAQAITWNRFSGPGRVGLQSMYLHLESGN